MTKSGTPGDPKSRLMGLIMGSIPTQLIRVAAELGIADVLAAGPVSARDLSVAVGAHSESLERAMRALVALEVFAQGEDGRFELGHMGELLTTGNGSLRHLSMLKGVDFQWQPQGALLHQVKTGELAFESCFGKPYFDHVRSRDGAAQLFDKAMTDLSEFDLSAIVQAFDFSSTGTLVDVGAGEGALMAGLLEANRGLRGIVADIPEAVAKAVAKLEERGLSARCHAVSCDFFDSVPAGGDAYLMRMIMHDWDDENAVRNLRNCRARMGPDSRLLVIENVIAKGPDGLLAKLLDVEMMVYLGGKERTEDEFRALFRSADFELVDIVPTASPSSIMVGVPD